MEILPQLLVNALIAGSIYALASSGLSLAYGLLRVLNFAHGHLMMVGAYCFYFARVQQGWGLLSSAIFTTAFAALLASFTLRVFVLPFSKYSFMLTFITTLALGTILESLVSIGFGVNVKSLSPGSAASSIEIWGMYITPIQIIIIASALILLFVLGFFIHHTSLGRTVRALSQHSQAAESLGVSRRKVSYFIFILGTVLAAYAGILVGYETNMQPTMGTTYTIKAFAAMILGGLGNIWGTIAGSYILGLVENLSIGLEFGPFVFVVLLGIWSVLLLLRFVFKQHYSVKFWTICTAVTVLLGGAGYFFRDSSIPAGYKDAFAFAIILLVLLFRPEGLFSSRTRKA